MSNQCLRRNDRLILIVEQNIELARHHFWSTAQCIHKFNDYSVVNPRFPQKGTQFQLLPWSEGVIEAAAARSPFSRRTTTHLPIDI